jgi:hypothetical protein
VRRVVLHRIRDTHTILADQWRLPVRVTGASRSN